VAGGGVRKRENSGGRKEKTDSGGTFQFLFFFFVCVVTILLACGRCRVVSCHVGVYTYQFSKNNYRPLSPPSNQAYSKINIFLHSYF